MAGETSEGQLAQITYTDANGGTVTVNDPITWLDEPRFNGTPGARGNTNPTAFPAVSTGETQIPIDTIVNESNVSAFLDPMAYANVVSGAYDPRNTGANNPDQPHRIWLFWNSTRNGTADIYYETVEPRFSSQ